jgi:hypothetical protein
MPDVLTTIDREVQDLRVRVVTSADETRRDRRAALLYSSTACSFPLAEFDLYEDCRNFAL